MDLMEMRRIIDSRGTEIIDGVSDADELSEQLVSMGLRPLSVIPLSRRSRLDAHMRALPGGHSLSFIRMSFGADASLQSADPDEDHVVLAVNVSGTASFRYGGAEVTLIPGVVGFIPPNLEFRTRVSSDFDQVLMPITRTRLERIAGSLLDSRDPGHVDFDYTSDVTGFGAEATHLLVAAAMICGSDSPMMSDRLARRMEDVAIEAALMSMRSFRARIPRQGAAHSRSVRTGMDYMMAHLSEPLTLGRVASRAMVSPRALQVAFKKETGDSPMRWLRSRRLEHARRLLEGTTHSPVAVTEAAFSVGFLHLGYFSRRYAEQFGEAPSSTRRRALADRAQSR